MSMGHICPLVIWMGSNAKCFPRIVLFSSQRNKKEMAAIMTHILDEEMKVHRVYNLSKAR